nr:15788_t:CDS:2 [Entrophospora candida]
MSSLNNELAGLQDLIKLERLNAEFKNDVDALHNKIKLSPDIPDEAKNEIMKGFEEAMKNGYTKIGQSVAWVNNNVVLSFDKKSVTNASNSTGHNGKLSNPYGQEKEEEESRERHGYDNDQHKSSRQREDTKDEVFVNNMSNIDIPKDIINILNRGSNFQILKKTAKFNSVVNELSQIIYFLIIDTTISKHNKKLYNYRTINKNINKCVEFLLNNNLVVSPADKNLGLTIIPKEWYISELNKYILNTNAFEKKTIDWYRVIDQYKWIDERYDGQYILKWNLNIDNKDKIPKVYILPKVHKCPSFPIDIKLVKSRYITPNIGWINERASKWLAKELQPLLSKVDWVIESSLDFQNKLPPLQFVDTDVVIFTADVKDMYPSITRNLALHALNYAQNILSNDPTHPKWNVYRKTLQWIFNTSFIEYKGDAYIQRKGLPMGNPVSPILANLTLAMAECNVFTTEMITKIKIYRYLDDIVAFVDNSFLDTYPNRILGKI